MKKVYHVRGKDLEKLDYFADMDIYNGDVYGFDDPEAGVIWIWIGSKSSVEESTVAAWFANKLDQQRGGSPEVMTINEGEEPMIFRENWSINVIDDDTPGFLRKAEFDIVEFKLYKVFTEEDTVSLDEAKTEEVEIGKSSLTSDDVFVLDGNDVIYCWIGKQANVEEKRMGQKLMQKIDADRHYMPLQYTVYEGDNDRIENGFYELIEKLEKLEPEDRKATSVEDTREQLYQAEEERSVEGHKSYTDQTYNTTDPSERSDPVVTPGTDKHKKMVDDTEKDDAPKPGTVQARLAAINARNQEKDQDMSTSKFTSSEPGRSRPEPIKPKTPTKTTPDIGTTSETDKSKASREFSRKYGGAPEPELGELEEGPGEEPVSPETDISDEPVVKAEVEPRKDNNKEKASVGTVKEQMLGISSNTSESATQTSKEIVDASTETKDTRVPQPDLTHTRSEQDITSKDTDTEENEMTEEVSKVGEDTEIKTSESAEVISQQDVAKISDPVEKVGTSEEESGEERPLGRKDEVVKVTKASEGKNSEKSIETPAVKEKTPDAYFTTAEMEEKEESTDDIHEDKPVDSLVDKEVCVAVEMHATVWQAGKACTVCGMEEEDCPVDHLHQQIWAEGASCKSCRASL